MNNAWSEMVSSTPCLPFIPHGHLGCYKQYGITPLPIRTSLVGLLQPYYISMTTSNLVLTFQQRQHCGEIHDKDYPHGRSCPPIFYVEARRTTRDERGGSISSCITGGPNSARRIYICGSGQTCTHHRHKLHEYG